MCFLAAAIIPEAHNKDIQTEENHKDKGVHDQKYDHDQFLGKDQAKEFEELTPEQSKDRLSKMIPLFDKDADSFITEEELKGHIAYMQKRYVLNDVDRTWKGHPTEDNKLSWKEYRESVYGPENPERELEKEYKKMMERDQRRWKTADQNKDDNLDKEEYACFVHPESCEHMKDLVVSETVEDIDKNKDGFVDADEYIMDMYRPDETEKDKPEPDWVKSERQMFSDYRDKNKDGKLDKAEMRDWIMPVNFDHSEAEAKHLINMADDDKDGKLSKKEILDHYDVFVGSQATDYGEQLQRHDPSEL